MKRLLAILLAIMLLAGCGGETPVEEPAVNEPVASEHAEEPIEEPADEPASEPAEEPAEEPASEPSEKPTEEPAEEPAKEAYDINNVSFDETQNALVVKFEKLPETAEDMQAIVDAYSIDDPRKTVGFFIAAVSRYNESAEDAFDMIDVLRGPQPMSDGDKAFMKERFSDKLYLPDAYFSGATPANDYKTEAPYVIEVYDVYVEAPEGYAYGEVVTAGADSPRRVTLREKDGNFYIWEYNGILLSIRIPASEDPWA